MKCVIDQYAKEVRDFSSQYGSSGSISYVAANLIGKPTLYPEYGDFSASYSMKTYGLWWKTCPSSPSFVQDSCPLLKPSEDFVDLLFETAVHPIRVDIYETYNPGSVVRVWGSLEGKKWVILWSGNSSCQLPQARIFSPPIIQVEKFINMLRLEFDQGCQKYYSAFDAVMLVGATHVSQPEMFHPLSISSSIISLGLHESSFCEESILAGARYLLSDKLQKNLEIYSISSSDDLESEEETKSINESKEEKEDSSFEIHMYSFSLDSSKNTSEEIESGFFSVLPEELVLHILNRLDLQSLCRLACTCKAMNTYVAHPMLYRHLNLKNCWWLVNEGTLEWLLSKCSQLKSLDLSWCGGYEKISSQTFMEFIHQCGHNLSVLYLNNCHFVDNYCLYIIANTCWNLEAFSLTACCKVDHLGFGELKKLTSLKFLDLSRTRIEFGSLHILLQHVKKLQHLLLNNCLLLDLDEVVLTLATFNPCLVSLGAWKTQGLTSRGLKALACIRTLEDLDLGWALSGPVTEGLSDLLQGCPNLKRLFLTALRTLTDQDVNKLINYGSSLEQVDLMGTRNLSPDVVYSLLNRCSKLQLLDVSYCEQIHFTIVQQWRSQFPNVSIKGGLKHHVRVI